MSADPSTTARSPRPRVADFHSAARVAAIFAADESRRGTSDGSGLNGSCGGRSVVTRTVNDVGAIGRVGMVKAPVFVSLAAGPWQLAVNVPVPAGMRGVGYVQLTRPSGPALCCGSEPGGMSP